MDQAHAALMDYDFFHSLTAAEARAYLDRFLEVEHQALEEMKPVAASEEINLDFSLSSLADALKWMVKRVHCQRVPVPEDEPWWIRQAHPDGLVEFDDGLKTIILRAAYYLGECFARLPGLSWTTGDAEYLQKNMSVIAGFRGDDELPPLVVVNNMFARILGDGMPIAEIDLAIEVWTGFRPSSPA